MIKFNPPETYLKKSAVQEDVKNSNDINKTYYKKLNF